MRNLDFLWLVLLGWLIAILTVLTGGWRFMFQNDYPNLGLFWGSATSAVLATTGGIRSIRAKRHHPEILYWGSLVLAITLIVLLVVLNIVIALVIENFTHFGS
jgi:hypothetical protein